jgi:hypothetical protein
MGDFSRRCALAVAEHGSGLGLQLLQAGAAPARPFPLEPFGGRDRHGAHDPRPPDQAMTSSFLEMVDSTAARPAMDSVTPGMSGASCEPVSSH